MLKRYLEEFWWLLVLIAIVIVMVIAMFTIKPNGNEFDIVEWVVNPANPSSPIHQIMP